MMSVEKANFVPHTCVPLEDADKPAWRCTVYEHRKRGEYGVETGRDGWRKEEWQWHKDFGLVWLLVGDQERCSKTKMQCFYFNSSDPWVLFSVILMLFALYSVFFFFASTSSVQSVESCTCSWKMTTHGSSSSLFCCRFSCFCCLFSGRPHHLCT